MRLLLLKNFWLMAAVATLPGCATAFTSSQTSGSIEAPVETQPPVKTLNEAGLALASERVGAAYAANPKDRNAGLQYAQLLAMTGKNTQALAVMQQVAIQNPTDREVLSAYGKAQAGAGQLQQALDTITRAQTPDRPDWRLKSAEGAILDQLGRLSEARMAYRDALDLKPGEPSVLSNLAMSYLLAGDLKTAERHLRTAIADPSADSGIRQNLALVTGLQGRFDEAEQIARQELSTEQATANVARLKAMLAKAPQDAQNTN